MTRTPYSTALATQFAALAVVDKAIRGVPSRVYGFDCGGQQYVHRLGLLEARRAESSGGVAPVVDKTTGILRNVSIATIGPALGHNFSLDAVSLSQIADSIRAAGPDGVRCNFKHSSDTEIGPDGQRVPAIGESLGTMIGRIRGPRMAGKSLLGDLYFGDYAAALPGVGNVRDYLLDLADEDPGAFGLSAMFDFELEPVFDNEGTAVALVARINNVFSVDTVAMPAANPRGLGGMSRGRRPIHRIDKWHVKGVDDREQRQIVQAAAALAPRLHGKDSAALGYHPRIGMRDAADTYKLLAFLHKRIRDVAEDLIATGRVDVV